MVVKFLGQVFFRKKDCENNDRSPISTFIFKKIKGHVDKQKIIRLFLRLIFFVNLLFHETR